MRQISDRNSQISDLQKKIRISVDLIESMSKSKNEKDIGNRKRSTDEMQRQDATVLVGDSLSGNGNDGDQVSNIYGKRDASSMEIEGGGWEEEGGEGLLSLQLVGESKGDSGSYTPFDSTGQGEGSAAYSPRPAHTHTSTPTNPEESRSRSVDLDRRSLEGSKNNSELKKEVRSRCSIVQCHMGWCETT